VSIQAQIGYQAEYKEQVRILGAEIGYGNMMELARECWNEKTLAQYGTTSVAFVVGPCGSATVPCGCEKSYEDDHCDWCCGSGWLTKRVKQAKDEARGV
jgi:hypothetical protein